MYYKKDYTLEFNRLLIKNNYNKDIKTFFDLTDYDNYYNLNIDEKDYVKIIFEAILDKMYINSYEKDIIKEIDIMQQILKGNEFR
jgi:hypothetical protein